MYSFLNNYVYARAYTINTKKYKIFINSCQISFFEFDYCVNQIYVCNDLGGAVVCTNPATSSWIKN